MTKQLYFE